MERDINLNKKKKYHNISVSWSNIASSQIFTISVLCTYEIAFPKKETPKNTMLKADFFKENFSV
jgi:hypothetical protein